MDYRDWQVPLGRRFRALKLWFVLRWYGVEGLRSHLRSGIAHAAALAERLRADERFEVVAPHPFSLVCFRLRAGDAETEALHKRLRAEGSVYVTHTRVNGAYVIRLAIGSPLTERRHVDAAWELISAHAAE